MAQNNDRSMNNDMRIAAVEGRVRFLRPNTTNAEMEEAVMRASVLEGPHYGSMGVTFGNLPVIRAALPGAVHPLAPIRIGKHEVVDPL